MIEWYINHYAQIHVWSNVAAILSLLLLVIIALILEKLKERRKKNGNVY